MGVIKSQSIFATVFTYIGVVIGFVTSALVMPKVLATDQLGLVKLVTAVTGVFSGIFTLGVGQIILRIYPIFETQKQKLDNLYFYVFKVALIGCLIAIPFYYFTAFDLFNFEEEVLNFEKSIGFLILVYFVIVARVIYNVQFGFARMLNKIVFDSIIQNILLKGGMLLFIVLFAIEFLDYTSFVYGYAFLYMLFPLLMYFFFRKIGFVPKYKSRIFFDKIEKSSFFSLGLFGMLTTVGGSLFLYLDTLMVNYYLDESAVGIYGTLFLFGVIVSVPARSLKGIAVSVLSKAINREDLEEVKNVYQKSSITLLVIGIFLFLGIITNDFLIFSYLPDAFGDGFYIIFFIGLAQLSDLATGVNNEILATSKYYRLNTYFILISIVVAMVSNIVFIPLYDITGAALATFCSVFAINLLRLFAIWKIYRILPFSKNTIIVFLLGLITYFLVSLIPQMKLPIVDFLMRGALVTLIYLPAVFYLKVSTDINDLILSLLRKVMRK